MVAESQRTDVGVGIPTIRDRVQPRGMSAFLAIGLAIESLVEEICG
jgi:hypothetical protein